jgi:hypothetical protein
MKRARAIALCLCLCTGCGGGCSSEPLPPQETVGSVVERFYAKVRELESRLNAYIPETNARMDSLEGRVRMLEDRLENEWVIREEQGYE